MALPLSNLGEHKLYPLCSTVRDLVVIPFGFTVDSDGAITADDNANPPQVYVEAGVNDQAYTLKCPKGNSSKFWAHIACEEDIAATILTYSGLSSGSLTISLSASPAGDTLMKGFLAYGRNYGEGTGAVAAAPAQTQDLASLGKHPTKSVLKQGVVFGVSWTVNGSNVVTEVRGAPGAAVEGQGSGVYWISFDNRTPPNFPDNWSEIVNASDGRRASISHSAVTAAGRKIIIVTFEDGANMGNGEHASYLAIGSTYDWYEANYGGESGGVHSDYVARDIGTYSQFPLLTTIPGAVFIPVRVTIASGAGGPTAASSPLAPNFRIVRASSGVYTIYIGRFLDADLVCGFQLSGGTAIGATDWDGAAGTITLTAPGGDPGVKVLTGYILVKAGQAEA
jgi:hypothetical protein